MVVTRASAALAMPRTPWACAAHGRRAGRQGLLLTCALANTTARRFYAARGLAIAPISPSVCAPAAIAAHAPYDVLQDLWDADAVRTMEARGARARTALHAGNQIG